MSRWLAIPTHHTAAFRADGRLRFLLAPERLLEDEPPLPFLLDDREIAEILDGRLTAVSHFGPAGQDKASNEDFALSAVIDLGSGRLFGFAALADGVSTHTFWAARAARIACFGAYRAIRGLLARGFDPGGGQAAAKARTAVASVVARLLARDCDRIERAGAIPAGWDPEVYRRHKHDRAMWYRSTLLFGVVGECGGLIGFAGDGGVRGLIVADETSAADPEERRIVHSVDGQPLSAYVSLGFEPHEIATRRIETGGRTATHVLFASDGVDKALQGFTPNLVEEGGARCRSRYRDLPLGSREEAFGFLEDFSRHPKVAAEPDNLSVARLSWPLPEPGGAPWATWSQDPLAAWRTIGEGPPPSPRKARKARQ